MGFRAQLDKCGDIISQLRLTFNCAKSWCLAFSPWPLPVVALKHGAVDYSSEILAIIFCADNMLIRELETITRSFYMASNNIPSNSYGLSE